MNWKVLAFGLFCTIGVSLNQAAGDVSALNKASSGIFKFSSGLVQDDPPLQTTPKTCGGWLGPKCEPTTTTTTPAPTPTPVAQDDGCGGWFQKACPPTTTTTTTPPPPTTATPCGGWFQPACEPKGLALVVTTPAPTTKPTTAPSCGGWFQPACEATTVPPTTPAPQLCGGVLGFFRSTCETPTTRPTPAPLTQSCGWLYCVDLTTAAPVTAKSRGWGLFGRNEPASTTTPAPAQGWISGMVSGVIGTAGKAVDTALDVTSKIATVTMNGGVDFMINQVKIVTSATGMDVVPLPDLDIPLYPGASLKATGGYFKSLMSISRGGDIVVSRDGLAFIIDFPVELKNMEIGFKNYEIAVFMGMGTSGVIKVGVKENKINVRIRLAISTSCAINVEKVDFAVLDGLDISMTYGCSMCGYITDKATSYLANFLQNTIRLQIQGQIDSILKKTLSENALICSKFMGK